MKFRDLTAVYEIDAEEMATAMGGGVVVGKAQPQGCWGAVNVATAQPGGQANNLGIKDLEVMQHVTNLGQLIKSFGGNVAIKPLFGC